MPQSVDSVIHEALMHAYDPIKAHEYYMMNRHLKGRHHGAQPAPSAGPRRGGKIPPHQKPHGIPPELQARIKHLEARLNELRDHLRKLLASKQKRAHDAKHPKPLNAQQKQKKANAARQYQQQHKSQIAQKHKQAHSGGSGGGTTPISSMTEKQLREAIVKTSENLHAAVEKARAVANRGTA